MSGTERRVIDQQSAWLIRQLAVRHILYSSVSP